MGIGYIETTKGEEITEKILSEDKGKAIFLLLIRYGLFLFKEKIIISI